MSSASSPVKDVLEGYLAGRVQAERVVEVVAAAYYGERGAGRTEQMRPLMEIVERAHPGVVELAGTADRPGFAVRLKDRPFPTDYEGELRRAVEAVLARGLPAPRSPLPASPLLSRLYAAVRRWFSASS